MAFELLPHKNVSKYNEGHKVDLEGFFLITITNLYLKSELSRWQFY